MAGDSNGRPTHHSLCGEESIDVLTFEDIKPDVYRMYIEENKTLKEVMLLFPIKASPRIWKKKLKGWGFNKNLPNDVKEFIVAKGRKRKREGKPTEFNYTGTVIETEKIDNIKRRKTKPIPLAAETPPGLTYYTPEPSSEESYFDPPIVPEICSEDVQEIRWECSSDTSSLSNSSRLSVTPPSISRQSLHWNESRHTAKINLPEMPILSALDRFLNDEHDPWSPVRLSHQLGDHEIALSKNQRILDQVTELVNVVDEPDSFPEICCIDNQFLLGSYFAMNDRKQDEVLDTVTSGELLLEDLFTQTVTLAKFQNMYGEFEPLTLQQEFKLAKSAERSGNNEEAEYHCRRIIGRHHQIDVLVFLATILAKSSRLEESTHLLFSAITEFIMQFNHNLIEINDCLFGPIIKLFKELFMWNQDHWTSLRSCIINMMATMRDATTSSQISTHLFIHGFSIAQQCYSLRIIDSAKYMFEELLKFFPFDAKDFVHYMEKARAHQSYAQILKEEGRWISSAEQLLLACKATTDLGTRGSPLVSLLMVDFHDIIPHLAPQSRKETLSLVEDIRHELARNKEQSSIDVPATLEADADAHMSRYLQSDLPISLASFPDVAQRSLPLRTARSAHGDGEFTSTGSMSSNVSHKNGKTYASTVATGISDPFYGFY